MENNHIYQCWLKLAQIEHTTTTLACFKEVEKQYTQSHRQYHTLTHIQDLFDQIKTSELLKNEKALFAHAALFHDVIYKSTAKDNEYQSAQFAAVWLDTIGIDSVPQQTINDLIIATATHTADDALTQLFLDMDMSILGASLKAYTIYYHSIRKEYSKIPYLLYKQGRKRFLKDTLKRTHIFLTEAYRVRFEKQARINMQEELATL